MDRFDDWVRFVFDHPIDEDWYFADEYEVMLEDWCSSSQLNVERLAELLRHPEALTPFSREQIAHGFWFLLGPGAPFFNDSFYDASVYLDLRLGCIRAAAGFFELFIAKQCEGRDPHTHEELEGLAFMWWDLWLDSFDRARSAEARAIDRVALETMGEIGRLPSLACAWAALHGLNHKAEEYPREVERAVDSMLERSSGWPLELVEYAKKARRGECQ